MRTSENSGRSSPPASRQSVRLAVNEFEFLRRRIPLAVTDFLVKGGGVTTAQWVGV